MLNFFIKKKKYITISVLIITSLESINLQNYFASYLFFKRVFNATSSYKSNQFNYFFDYFFKRYLMLKTELRVAFSFRQLNFFFLDEKIYFLQIIKYLRRFIIFEKVNLNFYKNFIKVFLFIFFFIDTKIFTSWLKQLCESSDLKMHKPIFVLLKILFNFFFKNFSFFFKIRGYFLIIKGKIAGGGNSKKKKIVYKDGSFTLSKNNLSVSYSRDFIRTFSGVLGFLFFITF